MIEKLDNHASSAHIGEGSSERGLILSDEPYFLPINSASPYRGTQDCHAAYTAFSLSLVATVYIILYGFWCLRNVDLAQTVSGDPHERMLSVAEIGSFKRCVGDSGEQLIGFSPSPPRPLGATMQLLSTNVVCHFQVQETNLNEESNKSSIRTPTVGGREEHAFLEQPAGVGNQDAKLKQTLPGGEQHVTPKRIVGGGQLRDPCNEKRATFHAIDPIETIPDDAELQRLRVALLVPAADAKNLTAEDLALIREANCKLLFFMKERRRLANELHKTVESRQRLASWELKLSSKKLSGGGLGRFRRLLYATILRTLRRKVAIADAKILAIGADLKNVRSALRVFTRRREQRALSLRIMARRRQKGSSLTTREANALSIAALIMHGSKKRNYVPTSGEGEEVVKMGFELSAALQDARLLLSSLLEEATSENGSGSCPKCADIKKHVGRCDALQKEASMYALQLRSVTATFSPEKVMEIIMKVEEETLQLRKKAELAIQFVQRHSSQREEEKP